MAECVGIAVDPNCQGVCSAWSGSCRLLIPPGSLPRRCATAARDRRGRQAGGWRGVANSGEGGSRQRDVGGTNRGNAHRPNAPCVMKCRGRVHAAAAAQRVSAVQCSRGAEGRKMTQAAREERRRKMLVRGGGGAAGHRKQASKMGAREERKEGTQGRREACIACADQTGVAKGGAEQGSSRRGGGAGQRRGRRQRLLQPQPPFKPACLHEPPTPHT